MSNITGTGVALITPFNNDSSIDYNSLQKLIEHVIEGGIDFSSTEKYKDVFRQIIKSIGRART